MSSPIDPVFAHSGLYPPALARALDALRALAVRIDAEGAPFTRQYQEGGTLREAEALVSRMARPVNAERIVRAIVDQAYGPTLARALYAELYYGADTRERHRLLDDTFPFVPRRINVEHVPEQLASARRALDSIAQYGPPASAPRLYY
jgi:hypothetical protein